ncbi:MAG TPA: molybdopterin cofactor-binding domain-containing protein [Allosphingosinicella sp.]|nr:molybdopterin cofactor-binding domain-containing protein [Allosphingosinicella sp.]
MASDDRSPRITRRTLLIGGGAGAGLLVAWALWPRIYRPNLRTAPDETLFNAFLKIGTDGRVIVAVPQAELGQGAWTSLPQILADELGAAWETVAVEPAPLSPLYANRILAEEAANGVAPAWLAEPARWAAREYAVRGAHIATAGSTSTRAFESRMREAGAGARALLMKAAAARWNTQWDTLDTAGGFVVNPSGEKLRFAELVEAAAGESLPDILPMRGGIENRLSGQPLTRLDLPAKIDGSARFAGDVRLPDMVFASVRAAPAPGARLERLDRDAAQRVPGLVGLFDTEAWVAALASNWWAADRALKAANPGWRLPVSAPSRDSEAEALAVALAEGKGTRLFSRGDIGAVFSAGPVLRATYGSAPMANAPLETLTATARLVGDQLEIWAPAQAPGLARDAAARAAGLPRGQVTLYPMLIGGGYGRKVEVAAIEQSVVLAMKARRPVQVVWSRAEESVQDTLRPPVRAEVSARMAEGGVVLGWQARIAAPEVSSQLEERLGSDARLLRGPAAPAAGAVPPYSIPAVAVDHLPSPTAARLGLWRSGAHGYTAFFTESFVDELSRIAGIEPLSFRMQMLGENPRLARCLSTAAALGGWDGGQSGSALGLAAHSAFGSHIATLLEIEVEADQRIRVLRAVCAVDCGRIVNPTIVRQQIEGGLLFGIAAATGTAIGYADGMVSARGFGHFDYPTLARSPEVTVELIDSDEPSGGATELGVPTAAPAIANAMFALTGRRLRALPLGSPA